MKEELIIDFLKIFIISLGTIYCDFKIINITEQYRKNFIKLIIFIIIIDVICIVIKKISNYSSSIICLNVLLAIILANPTKINIGYAMLINTISFSINNIICLISLFFLYIIMTISHINNNVINMTIVFVLYYSFVVILSRIRKIKYGITFLIKNKNNEFFEILILNISVTVFLCFATLSSFDLEFVRSFVIYMIIFAVIMFVTIQKSLQLYYKQKMLVKDLEETKEELKEKNNRIKELEKEIIKSGEKSHSISHRQDILEHKLEKLSVKSEISEMDIKSRIEKVGKDIRKEPVIALAKTGIVEIDDVLDYMKSECSKKKIDFQLQLSGNIYKMINNYVSKDELEILLADHIKNAIIAIEHSENINKSILVRLGRLDGTYGLYVYDSGIEFEIETFLKLGKKPATTHKDSGGTGMGFMNTFDTLRKHNASFIIEEYGKPVTDNFTKVLKFKFDNKNEFKICTYRKEEIEKQDKEKILKVENLMF